MSNAKLISTKISEAESALADLKNQQTVITKEVVSFLKELVAAGDVIKRVNWTQYTPYFNDGDACEFNVHDVYFTLTEETVKFLNERGFKVGYNSRDFEVDEEYSSYDIKRSIDVINYDKMGNVGYVMDALDKFSDFISDNPEALKTAFGDHAQVVVTADGIEVEEYEHD